MQVRGKNDEDKLTLLEARTRERSGDARTAVAVYDTLLDHPIFATLALYQLFKSVDPKTSTLMAVLMLVSVPGWKWFPGRSEYRWRNHQRSTMPPRLQHALGRLCFAGCFRGLLSATLRALQAGAADTGKPIHSILRWKIASNRSH